MQVPATIDPQGRTYRQLQCQRVDGDTGLSESIIQVDNTEKHDNSHTDVSCTYEENLGVESSIKAARDRKRALFVAGLLKILPRQ
jgi:hypothetical protein